MEEGKRLRLPLALLCRDIRTTIHTYGRTTHHLLDILDIVFCMKPPTFCSPKASPVMAGLNIVTSRFVSAYSQPADFTSPAPPKRCRQSPHNRQHKRLLLLPSIRNPYQNEQQSCIYVVNSSNSEIRISKDHDVKHSEEKVGVGKLLSRRQTSKGLRNDCLTVTLQDIGGTVVRRQKVSHYQRLSWRTAGSFLLLCVSASWDLQQQFANKNDLRQYR